ncbi:MAG: tRNA (5-methylaminomethyl-2-thiouridine)(34)-methyltransferase MnmD [Trueperaceae bacterium]
MPDARQPAAPDVIVTADGSRTLRSGAHGQTYKSRLGALSESRTVYAEGSGVAARLAAGTPASVLEIGFGTALNFLVTSEAARVAGTKLQYVAVESDLLSAAILRMLAHEEALAPSPLPAAFLAWRAALEDEEATREPGQAPTPRRHRWRVGPVALDLVVGNVLDDRTWALMLPDAGRGRGAGFDAIYHDAFSPAVSPELWSSAFLARLAGVLAPGGRLVSYSVAGAVRRALAVAGLEVRKAPGPPGGKAEALVATRPERQP